MGKKSSPPPPPDLTPISNAQIAIAQQSNAIAMKYLGLSEAQMQWMQKNAGDELSLARQQADRLFGLQNKAFESDKQARAFAQEVGQTQMDAMRQQMGYAAEDRKRYENVFLPMQDRFIDEANQYDTPARREAAASQSMVDVQRQADAQRQQADAQLSSMGIDPSQVRSSSLMNQLGVQAAGAQALAGNNARTQVENTGRSLRASALNIGMGLPAQASAGYQGAGQSGQGAVNAGMAGQNAQLQALQGGANLAGQGLGWRSNALQNVANLTGTPMQWGALSGNMMGNAMAGYSSAGNMLNQGYQNQMAQWQAGQAQNQQQWGNILGGASAVAGFFLAEGGDVDQNKLGGALGGGGFANAIHPIMAGGNLQPIAAGGSGGVLPRPFFPPGQGPGQGYRPPNSFPPYNPGPMPPTQQPPWWMNRFGGGPQFGGGFQNNVHPIFATEGFDTSNIAAFTPDAAGSGTVAAAEPSFLDKLRTRLRAAQAHSAQGGGGSPSNVWADHNFVPQGQVQVLPTVHFNAEGGGMPMRAQGALPMPQSRDQIPAMLAHGEFVVPADVVRSKGIEFFDKLVGKYHRENA
jgi:hypothetical protein